MDWFGREPWPHQARGIDSLVSAVRAGHKRLCLTSPTGMGKTVMMGKVVDLSLGHGSKVVLYTNRKLLASQTIDVMRNFGLEFGVRAAGPEDLADATQPFQIAMVQTEQSRMRNRLLYQPVQSDVVLIDECHNLGSGGFVELLDRHVEEGATIIGFTATPLGVGHIYKELVTAGTVSEGRSCGALLPARVFGPDEPEAALRLKRTKTGEFLEGDVVKAIMTPTIFGRVLEHYRQLNPQGLPAILFGPGVKESIWFAERFCENGVSAAHIDGEIVWINGESHRSTPELRDEVLADSKSGRIKVICNRFVMREGIDAPWLYHCILATVFGSVNSYLQSVGRILRNYAGYSEKIIQDHGGNWWRHGSPNADRIWDLSLDPGRYAAERAERLRNHEEPEPIVCPKCGAVRLMGPRCVTCGHEATTKCRPVIQEDGNLVYMRGDIFRARKIDHRTDTEKNWESIFWRCRKSGRTFSQGYGLFHREHGYWPPKDLPLMPKDALDWHAHIQDVPWDQLHPKVMKPSLKTQGTLFS